MANIALNEDAQLNLNMEAMTVNTEGHCDEWNVRHQQLLENDQYLNGEQEKIKEPEFIPAVKRENIVSKEKLPKIFGKIAKFFADLKTVAFSGSYNDLRDKPGIVNNNTTTQAGLALDARQANPNIEGTMAANILQLNNDSMATDIEWTDRIQKSGVYRVTVNESSRYAAAKYLPYDTDGNIGDIWIVNAIAFNSRYIGLYAIQLNANRSGFGRLDTETLNMSWNN